MIKAHFSKPAFTLAEVLITQMKKHFAVKILNRPAMV